MEIVYENEYWIENFALYSIADGSVIEYLRGILNKLKPMHILYWEYLISRHGKHTKIGRTIEEFILNSKERKYLIE
jgi:hypothetical protein